MTEWFDFVPVELRLFAIALVAALVGCFLGFVLVHLLLGLMRRLGASGDRVLITSIAKNLRRPLSWFGAFIGGVICVSFVVGDDLPFTFALSRLLETGIYISAAWTLVKAVDVVGDLLLERYSYVDQENNLHQRKIYTQLLYIKRLVTIIAAFLALAFVLLQFDNVKELGAGLLTSAGVAGIVIGLAAQKSLTNLLAGFQIAFTQPIRIDDQININGEVGRVEEITLTYVVMRIWNERRMIIPLGRFIDDSFENWTRASTELLGVVMIYADFSADVEAVRIHLAELLTDEPLWDGRVQTVMVTDSSEHAKHIRVLVSARNAGDAFNLRAKLREAMYSFLSEREEVPFPRDRVSVVGGSTDAATASAAV